MRSPFAHTSPTDSIVFITSIHARGLRDLPEVTVTDCERWVSLAGPSPAVTALGDAIELAFAALSLPALSRLTRRWGMTAEAPPSDAAADDLPDQCMGLDPIAVRSLLHPAARRSLSVTLELHLDPPLFGQLRDLAAREPRVVTALATRPTIRLAVGALFTTSLDAMAIHLDGFSVGDQRFPTHGKERPRWLHTFLMGLRTRFHRFDRDDDIPAQLLAAATSRDAHPAYRTWQDALTPDGPTLRIARGADERPVLMGDDLPLRRYGQAGLDRASLAAAIHLSGADILWAESSDPLLPAAVDADPSPLEQVFAVRPDGERPIAAQALDEQPALRASRPWGRPRE